MSNPASIGLPTGLRFYDELEKQCRFKYTCLKGVVHSEYQYAGTCSLPPFQLVRPTIPGTSYQVDLICVDTGEEYDINTLCPALVATLMTETFGLTDYITYIGLHACCDLPFTGNTLVYIRFADGTNLWYSELFYINGEGDIDEDTNYRLWSLGGRRSSDFADLRVWT